MNPDFTSRLRSAFGRFDPAVLPIALAGLVLVGAVLWLLGRPLPTPPPADSALTDQLAAQAARLESLAGRLAALEGRAPTDLAPLAAQLRAAATRAEAAERQATATAAALANLPRPDLSGLAPRSAVAELAQRLDAAIAALDGRLATASREMQGTVAQVERRGAAMEQSLGGFAGRIAANETGLAARTQSIETQNQRLVALEQQVAARLTALDGAIAQRAEAVAAQAARLTGIEQQTAARLAALEATTQRLAALEGRAARLAALDTLRALFDAGQPLGSALGRLTDAPPALTRFASIAPPTEASLRLGFEDAARAARAASEPAREGQGVVDSALARLSGLVTIRRGEDVVFGDAAAAEIERARRALEAGDVEACLRHLSRLSAPARAAMAEWLAQAEALVAARAALRQLAG